MKKLVLTIAIVLGVSFGAMSQQGGGLFQRGASNDCFGDDRMSNGFSLGMPNTYLGSTDNSDATPLGSGMLMFIALGTGYAIARRKREKHLKD